MSQSECNAGALEKFEFLESLPTFQFAKYIRRKALCICIMCTCGGKKTRWLAYWQKEARRHVRDLWELNFVFDFLARYTRCRTVRDCTEGEFIVCRLIRSIRVIFLVRHVFMTLLMAVATYTLKLISPVFVISIWAQTNCRFCLDEWLPDLSMGRTYWSFIWGWCE